LIDWHEFGQSPVNRLQSSPADPRGAVFNKALVCERRGGRQRDREELQQEIRMQNGNVLHG